MGADRVCTVAVGSKANVPEAVTVLFHCAIREKMPNPFYEYVADMLCGRPAPWGKRFAMACKNTSVQHMQEVHTYGVRAAVNFAELFAALVVSPNTSLQLATIRFMKFDKA